jgi:CubicO group peptidase (beta-lactamase class C family)
MADLQAEVQAAAGELVAAGTETGLQVAVLRHGRVLADVVSGVADPQTAKPVRHGTLFYAASAAKGVAASLAHVLAERGDITYDLRLADVWPEFAAHGKEHTTLRHVLLHTAGLPGLPRETTLADLCDRSTAPRRPRCATRPASVAAPTCSPPTSRRSAR